MVAGHQPQQLGRGLRKSVAVLNTTASWTALAERSGDSALELRVANEKRRRATLAAAVQNAAGFSEFVGHSLS